ncbi:MAG: hypothetical protein GYA51_11025 [Candidatus Methanofastidiosa archaeon]|jgi:hypothetical protein|nr:hypothetical protein [Candidatus Methanofastidiosa archaeon]
MKGMNILKKFWKKNKHHDIYKNIEEKIEVIDSSINLVVDIKEVKIKKITIKQ